ncbi:competence protein CoiA family protein [Symbioplanes lichenis]|uniref:competence protein CoiA family protein n=1 Tax=Symbioplanes lichenis TaxID=1629072 RepID=UPI0027381C36|nr:competence protein CoiA family protein [Actinoplanes lichenis]
MSTDETTSTAAPAFGARATGRDERHHQFQSRLGAGKQVLARDRDDPTGRMIVIPAGGAARLRPLADEGRLLCPLAECSTPAMTVVGGSRRHHFRHLRATGAGYPGPETIDHLTAKAVLERWLLAQAPDAVVRRDGFKLPSGQGPDLYAEVDGHRVAFEVQYSALTTAHWKHRHQQYVDAGIADVWLFSHRGIYCRTATAPRGTDGLWLKIPDVGRELLAAGLPLMWINPAEGLIATAVMEWKELQAARSPKTGPVRARTAVDLLEACRLTFAERVTFDDGAWFEAYQKLRKPLVPDAHGLRTPATDAALAGYASHIAAWVRRVPTPSIAHTGSPAPVPPAVERQDEQHGRSGPLAGTSLAASAGRPVPPFLEEDSTGMSMGAVPEAEWRLELLRIFDDIAPAIVDSWWLAAALSQARPSASMPLPQMAAMITTFLDLLARYGYVTAAEGKVRVNRGLRRRPIVTVSGTALLVGGTDTPTTAQQLDLFGQPG